MINYYEELKNIKNSDEFIYIINTLKVNNYIYLEEKDKYIEFIKSNLVNKNIFKEYILEDIPSEIVKEFLFDKISFPLLVIKEKNKKLIKISGIY